MDILRPKKHLKLKLGPVVRKVPRGNFDKNNFFCSKPGLALGSFIYLLEKILIQNKKCYL